jgi:hypothetical protein
VDTQFPGLPQERCAASYGVMPHEYIVTTGPGSNATTSWRAVS